MAGLDPAIGYPHQFANDAIPLSNPCDADGPVKPGRGPAMTGLDRCVQYVNTKGGWYYITHSEGRIDDQHSSLGRCGGCDVWQCSSAVGAPEVLTDQVRQTNFVSMDL
jgi:hypothetical protein